jgi:hypothetical protein
MTGFTCYGVLSSIFLCVDSVPPTSQTFFPIVFVQFNIPLGRLLTTCAGCLDCPSYFPRHQLLVLLVLCLHSCIVLANAIFLIRAVIVCGDFAEYKVFQEHVYCVQIDMAVLNIGLKQFVPESKDAFSNRRVVPNVKVSKW